MAELDFVSDRNPDICAYLYSKGATPDYVLKSDRVTEEDVAALDKVAFADQDNNLYPCHTKAACWQSAAHFIGRQKDNAAVLANIEKMASYHGIEADVAKIREVLQPEDTGVEKQASAEEPAQYALTVDFTGITKEGGVEHYYPVNSYDEVVDSAEDATADYNEGNLPIESMRKVASVIHSAAIKYGVPGSELTKEVNTIGSDNTPDTAMALFKLATRRHKGVDITPYEEELVALGKKASTMSLDAYMQEADTVADRLVALDKKAGVVYGHGIEDPYTLLMCGPSVREIEKAAATTVAVLGVRVPVADLANLADDDVDATFAKGASALIKEAKALVSGANSIETSCAASDKLSGLSKEAAMVLLQKLADTAW